MFFHLATNQDLESLKWAYSIKASNTKLPHNAALKIKEILLDDQLTSQEFIERYNQIIKSTQTLPWKTYLYLDNVKNKFLDQANQLSWFQIFSLVAIFGVVFFLYKSFIEKKPKRKKVLKNFIGSLIVRTFSVIAYIPALVQVYTSYLVYLLPKYPILFLIFPDFLRTAVEFYSSNALIFSYCYIFGTFYFGKYGFSRFFRFNWF